MVSIKNDTKIVSMRTNTTMVSNENVYVVMHSGFLMYSVNTIPGLIVYVIASCGFNLCH